MNGELKQPPAPDRLPAPDKVATVRKKAQRMRRARQSRSTPWHHLVQAGVLGWLMILPTVGFTLVGRILGVRIGFPQLAIVGLALGLACGVYFVFRSVKRSLEDEAYEARPAADDHSADRDRSAP